MLCVFVICIVYRIAEHYVLPRPFIYKNCNFQAWYWFFCYILTKTLQYSNWSTLTNCSLHTAHSAHFESATTDKEQLIGEVEMNSNRYDTSTFHLKKLKWDRLKVSYLLSTILVVNFSKNHKIKHMPCLKIKSTTHPTYKHLII